MGEELLSKRPHHDETSMHPIAREHQITRINNDFRNISELVYSDQEKTNPPPPRRVVCMSP